MICIAIGCTATDFPPLRGFKSAREPGVIDHRGGVEEKVGQQLDIGRFISLKKRELGAEDNDSIVSALKPTHLPSVELRHFF